VVEAARRAEGLVFAQVLGGDVRVGLGGVLDEVAEDVFVIVADDEDFADLGQLGDGLVAVLNDGMARNVKERLWAYVNG
jgi:hypothetical protein